MMGRYFIAFAAASLLVHVVSRILVQTDKDGD